jgi:hypothetical protein
VQYKGTIATIPRPASWAAPPQPRPRDDNEETEEDDEDDDFFGAGGLSEMTGDTDFNGSFASGSYAYAGASLGGQRNEYENLPGGVADPHFDASLLLTADHAATAAGAMGTGAGAGAGAGDAAEWYASLFDVRGVREQLERERGRPTVVTRQVVRRPKVVLSAQVGTCFL